MSEKIVYINDQTPEVVYISLEDARRSMIETVKEWWGGKDGDPEVLQDCFNDLSLWDGKPGQKCWSVYHPDRPMNDPEAVACLHAAVLR